MLLSLTCLVEIHEYVVSLDPRPIGANLGKRVYRGAPVPEIELPQMPGAGQHTFSNETFVEWATPMRTRLIEREEFSADSKDGEAFASDIDDDSTSLGHVSSRGDAELSHPNYEENVFSRADRAALSVSSMSPTVWAVETKSASN